MAGYLKLSSGQELDSLRPEDYLVAVGRGKNIKIQYSKFLKKLNVDAVENAQRVPAVPAGVLPDGEEGKNQYMEVVEAGTWTYGGTPIGTNAEGYKTIFWWDGTTWENNGSVKVQGEPAQANGLVEEGNLNPVSGGVVYESLAPLLALGEEVEEIKERTPTIDAVGENLFNFEDNEGAEVANIDASGNFNFHPSEASRIRTNYLTRTDVEGFIFAILDAEDKIVWGIRDDGTTIPHTQSASSASRYSRTPYEKIKGALELSKTTLVASSLNLPSTAIGRETSEGANDAPQIPLTTSGYTHPSVLYVGSGWNGYAYWMAITPTFGIIAQQPDSASYENPHIFCSNDGINWQEPQGISNPIDTPPAINSGYWSDTHLMLLPDGYLYCIYRGNAMPNYKLGISTNPNTVSVVRADVYKRSKDGVNWEDFTFIQGTNNAGLNGNGGIMSPAFVVDDGYINCFDVVWSTEQFPYVGEGQSNRVVMRRISQRMEDFKDVPYSQNNVVNFKNRPWAENHAVWHLDGCKWGNTWFLLLNTSQNNLDTGSDLYLAYSGDGWNFDVIEQPIALATSYRSCLVPLESSEGKLEFLLFNNYKTNGATDLKIITLKYT